MEPQGAQGNFVQQTDQVIAASCMSYLVNQNSAEFTLTEQPVDAGGKEDMRGKNSANCRTRMPVVEAHWNAICHEVRCDTTIAQKSLRLRLTTLSAYTRHQTQKHGEGSGHPYNSEDRGRPALRHVPYWIPNSSERPSPRQVRRPQFIDECS